MTDSNADLLSQLRIDTSQRDSGGGARWPWVVVALVVMVGAGAAWWSLAQAKTIEVQFAIAEPPPQASGTMAVLDASGYITARRLATVSSKITGKLAEVMIEEGDQVQQDQVLARLDATSEQAQLQLAQAQLAAMQAQIGQLETQLRQSERDLQRQQDLSVKNLTSTQALEDARTKVNTLNAQVTAQHRQIEVTAAQLSIAQVNLDNTVIRAPFSGVIIDKAAQPGEIISPMSAGGGFTRTGIGTIVDMDSLEIQVDVNEAFINRVKPGQSVEAVLDAYPNWKIPAEVIAIVPTADRAKATIRVRIAIKQKDARIVPDMGVRVSFFEERSQSSATTLNGVLVPASAIAVRQGKSVVYVIEQELVRQRTVTPGQTYGDLRLIESGLEDGVKVVRDPPAGLEDGTKIKLKTGS